MHRFCLVLALAALCGPLAAQSENRPNILLVITDDQRADHLGLLHPHLKTPHLDTLAETGVRFEDAFVTTSICAASRASILTGRFERTHGFTFGKPPLARRFTDSSWPRLLRQAGYRTGHIGKFGVKVERGVQKELYDVFKTSGAPYWKKRDGRRRHLTDITGDDALAFIENHEGNGPWCLTVSFNAPHAHDSNPRQYVWPEAEDGLYDDVVVAPPPHSEPAFFARHPPFIKKSLNRIRWKWRFDDEDKRQRMTKGYWRMITGVDRNIGRIRQAIERRGQADDTVVIFISDNGYFLGDRGFAGKWLPYEDSLRVPLIVNDPRPGAMKTGTRRQISLNIDVASTICEYAGVEAPAGYQGESLAPLVRGESPKWRDAFFFEHLMGHKDIPKLEGIRTSRYKYARFFEQDPPHEELYDLGQDPGETRNLVRSRGHLETLTQLRHRCDSRREELIEARRDGAVRRSEKRPNVVLIIGDDQHWSDYGFMGSTAVKTPHLDALARQGLVFTRGYVPTSLCCPSLASLITGVLPHRHRITGNEPPRPAPGTSVPDRATYVRQVREMVSFIDAIPTVPELLRGRGYWCLQTGKWWLGSYRRGGFTHGMTHGDPSRGGRHGDHGLTIGRRGLDPIWRFVDEAGDRPFFVWYAPFLPHTPHNPPKHLLEQYRESSPTLHIARYRAMCTWFDATVGELMAGLEKRGLADDTLFVFTCDNGWIQRPDRGGYAPRSKRSPYDGGLRTPIIVRWKGRVAPGRRDAPVMTTDAVRTILEVTGAPLPEGLPGLDLRNPAATARGRVLTSAVFRHNARDIQRPESNLTHRWAVRDQYKLIVPVGDGPVQLFDVVADPDERTDLAADRREVVRELTKRLDAWWPAAAR